MSEYTQTGVAGAVVIELNRPVVAPVVPAQVTRAQALVVLSQAGLVPAIEAAIDAKGEPAKTVASIAWKESLHFVRNGATVTMLAADLGLTDAQVDDLFIQAGQVQL